MSEVKEQRNKSGIQRTEHTFAMELRSERVWDYVRDQYVHRLIQAKGDGKPVEFTTQTEDGTLPFTDEEKLDSIQVEYTYLISSELQKQRSYYEEKLKLLEIETNDKVHQFESRLKAVSEEKNSLQSQLTVVSKEKASLEKRLADLKTKHDGSEKSKKAELGEIEELNKSLLANQVEYKRLVEKLESERNELQETNHDLMFNLTAQQQVATLSPDQQGDIQGGKMHVGPAAASPVGTGAKSKRRSTKK